VPEVQKVLRVLVLVVPKVLVQAVRARHSR
jgi:hypothetical protein